MSHVISLTTDFGNRDSYVSALKAVILSYSLEVQWVDISHEVSPQDVLEGQFLLESVWSSFPSQTIHLAIVDPGVGTKRKKILVERKDQFFVGPDNGIFSFLFSSRETKSWELNPLFSSFSNVSVFEGRDFFAHVVGKLIQGVPPAELGHPMDPSRLVLKKHPLPKENQNQMEGEIIWVDHFGNLVTNFTKEKISTWEKVIVGGKEIQGMSQRYEDVPSGQLLSLWNSQQRLEISLREGSAEKELKVGKGTKVIVQC